MAHRDSMARGPGTVQQHKERIKAAAKGTHAPQYKPSAAASNGFMAAASAAAAASASAAVAAKAAATPMSDIVVVPDSATRTEFVRFRGSTHFRERLLCATLAQRAIRIDDIRAMDERPGLRNFETSFLRLLDKVTNGSKIKINSTGTVLKYTPGVIEGGHILGVSHDCDTGRGIGYYLEPLLKLALFTKRALTITLTGVTNDPTDPSVDVIRMVTTGVIRQFGGDEPLDIDVQIKKRGPAPIGGGEVVVRVPQVKALRPISLMDAGRVKRVRGVAWTSGKVPAGLVNGLIDGAKGTLLSLLPDVHIYTDHAKGKQAGPSPGWGMTLVAESTSGVLLSSEVVASETLMGRNSGGGDVELRDIGAKAAALLLEEIAQGGVVDSAHQSTLLLLMILCPEDVSRARIGPLTPYAVESLRLYRELFGVQFKLTPDQPQPGEEDGQTEDGTEINPTRTIVAKCLGVGYKNIARRIA